MALMPELEKRSGEIRERLQELEALVREKLALEEELRHVEFLLRAEQRRKEGLPAIPMPPEPSEAISRPREKSRPTPGIATTAYKILQSEPQPLRVREIWSRFMESGIKVRKDSLGLALRRNLNFFEQDEKHRWSVKRQVDLPVNPNGFSHTNWEAHMAQK